MLDLKQRIFAVAVATLCAAPASAATYSESITFDATLTAGSLQCGFFGDTQSCADKFGTVSGSKANDLMLGKTLNGVYSGEISFSVEDDNIVEVTCFIGGADCKFGDASLRDPSGPSAQMDFSDPAFVLSSFQLDGEAGAYFFSTDYEIFDDGTVQQYSDVQFDLSNVEREIAVVPLMGSAGFLFAALGGFWGLSRRKRA